MWNRCLPTIFLLKLLSSSLMLPPLLVLVVAMLLLFSLLFPQLDMGGLGPLLHRAGDPNSQENATPVLRFKRVTSDAASIASAALVGGARMWLIRVQAVNGCRMQVMRGR